ncbi:putative mitochondrial protein AtMg00310 [Apium graveolens]|uniref:putative mitochondrial protein AtMg00310 n=1 Tax=Apium graveolens TaxID=4045 RepID=UPI003D7B1079
MSVFLLPLEVTKDIERTVAKYWWGSKQNNVRGIHWMSWSRMCRHKSIGGLGFRNFRDFNLALLRKQGWRFLTNPTRLVSRLFKARYFKSGNFLSSSLGDNPSFVWRSIWESMKLVQSGARWLVGNGNSIDIMRQPWLSDEQNPYVTTESQSFVNNKVSSLMNLERSGWDIEVIKDLFNDRDQECIISLQLNDIMNEDKLYWSKEASGSYSVKSAYRLLQVQKGLWNINDNASLWKKMWRIKAPPKALNLLWRALSGCLPTYVSLQL